MAIPLIASVAKGLLSSSSKKKVGSKIAESAVSSRNKEQNKIKKPSSKNQNKPKVTSSNYSYKKVKVPKVKKPKTKNPELNSSLISLQESIAAMAKTVNAIGKQKENAEKEKNIRKRKLGKKLKESGMENISGVYSISKNLVNKIPFIDRMKKFFMNILLGGIILWLVKNFEKVVDVIKGVMKKIKDLFDILNTYLFTPLFKIGEFLVKKIWPIIEGIMKLPPVDAAIQEIQKLMGEFEKLIPKFGNAKNELEKKKAELEGNDPPSPPQPSGTQPSGTQSGSAPSTNGYTPAKVIPGPVSKDFDFRNEVTEVAKRLDISEDYLYTVMDFETGGTFDPAEKNKAGSGATGLIQFIESTARGLGTSTQELSKMSRTEQLKYVEKFLKPKVKGGESLSDLYMAIIFPEAKGKSDDFVLFGKGAISRYGPGSRAYEQNKGLDINNDGSVTKAEASKKVMDRLPVAARKTQTSSQTSSPTNISGISAVDTGLKTGPSQYIGGSTDYHIDAQFMKNQPMEQKVAMLDQMARGYATQGRKIEFSNQAVSGEVYDPDLPYEDKVKLIERAFGAHSHSRYSDRSSIDFFVPFKQYDRWHSSAEGAPLLAPSVGGGSMSYSSGGDYGNFVEVKDPDGNVIFRMGHGDTRYGRSSGTVQFEEKKPDPTPQQPQTPPEAPVLPKPDPTPQEPQTPPEPPVLPTNFNFQEGLDLLDSVNREGLRPNNENETTLEAPVLPVEKAQVTRPINQQTVADVSKSASYERNGLKVIFIPIESGGDENQSIAMGGDGLGMSIPKPQLTMSNTYYRAAFVRDQFSV
jgi:hypothetical protein